jgi:hypothetical protein
MELNGAEETLITFHIGCGIKLRFESEKMFNIS